MLRERMTTIRIETWECVTFCVVDRKEKCFYLTVLFDDL